MRHFTLLLLAALLTQPALAADPGLGGAWVVDLSTDPGKPYTQPMGSNGVRFTSGSTWKHGSESTFVIGAV